MKLKLPVIIGIVVAVVVIILAVMLLGGGGGQKNEKWGYSVKVPSGYEQKGIDDAWWIVKPNDQKPEPQLSIVAKQGGDPNVVEDMQTTIASQEDVTINGISGKLFMVKYSYYPDKECPVYKLVKDNVVYTIEPNECMDSPIFDKVVKSFKF